MEVEGSFDYWLILLLSLLLTFTISAAPFVRATQKPRHAGAAVVWGIWSDAKDDVGNDGGPRDVVSPLWYVTVVCIGLCGVSSLISMVYSTFYEEDQLKWFDDNAQDRLLRPSLVAEGGKRQTDSQGTFIRPSIPLLNVPRKTSASISASHRSFVRPLSTKRSPRLAPLRSSIKSLLARRVSNVLARDPSMDLSTTRRRDESSMPRHVRSPSRTSTWAPRLPFTDQLYHMPSYHGGLNQSREKDD